MINARYISEDKSGVVVTLIENETLGNFYGPIELSLMFPSPGNKESDEIEKLIADGKLTIADYVTPPPVVRDDISRRQFYEQAYHARRIDEDEMLAAMGGKIPDVILRQVNDLPDAQRLKAKSLLAGAGTFYLSDPMTLPLAQLMGFNADTIRDYWSAAALL